MLPLLGVGGLLLWARRGVLRLEGGGAVTVDAGPFRSMEPRAPVRRCRCDRAVLERARSEGREDTAEMLHGFYWWMCPYHRFWALLGLYAGVVGLSALVIGWIAASIQLGKRVHAGLGWGLFLGPIVVHLLWWGVRRARAGWRESFYWTDGVP
jgi:hypothetical protein